MLSGMLETQIVRAIRKADDKIAVREFDLCCIALAGEVRHLCLDVCERDRFDGLSERHVRFDDRLAIRHIERMS